MIDAEGWDLPVLRLAVETPASEWILALIVEVNGASASYGISERALQRFMIDADCRPYAYVPDSRKLIPEPSSSGSNVIFLKDRAATEERPVEAS